MALLFNIAALGAMVLIWMLDWFGTHHQFYFIYSWWDLAPHFLGGVTLGLWLCAVSTRLKLSSRTTLYVFLVAVAVVGVGWEVLELVVGLEAVRPGYVFDTTIDLCADTLGVLATWLLYAFSSRSNLEENA